MDRPLALSTGVPNRPSQRALMRFLLKSSALENSDVLATDAVVVEVVGRSPFGHLWGNFLDTHSVTSLSGG